VLTNCIDVDNPAKAIKNISDIIMNGTIAGILPLLIRFDPKGSKLRFPASCETM
jgi:hypothetical protein